MTWIRTVSEKKAKGYVKRVYDAKRKELGFIPNIVKTFSLRPEIMKAEQSLYKTLMFGPSTLGRARREMIAIVVSRINDCHY